MCVFEIAAMMTVLMMKTIIIRGDVLILVRLAKFASIGLNDYSRQLNHSRFIDTPTNETSPLSFNRALVHQFIPALFILVKLAIK